MKIPSGRGALKWVALWLPWWLRWWSVCLQCGIPGFDPWVRKIPWRRKWPPTPVRLPGESHGQRSLVVYSPWGRRESNTTEQLHFLLGFPGGTTGKDPACQCKRRKRCRFDPWVGKIPREEAMTTPSSILSWRIPMDRGAWWTTVHRVAQSQTQLKWLSTSAMVQRLHFGLAKTLLELRYSLSLFLPSPAESFLLSFHRYQTCIAVWGFPYLHLLFLPLFFTGVSPSKSLARLILCSPLSLRGCYLT